MYVSFTIHPTPRPTARYSHGAAYDANNDRIVVFGGIVTGFGYYNDTWTYNGSLWSNAIPIHSPGIRSEMAMEFDSSNNKVYLFGGYNGSNDLNDTWEWNGSDWTQLFPVDSPSIRRGAYMAFDSNRNKMVLFGGYNGVDKLNDTWEFNGTNWVEVETKTVPDPRYAYGIAFDANRNKIVMFGGFIDPGSTYTNEVWEYDGENWVKRKFNYLPLPISRHAMCYDPTRKKIVVQGGITGGTRTGKYWEYDGSRWVHFPSRTSTLMFSRLVYYASQSRSVVTHGYSTTATSAIYDVDVKWAGSDEKCIQVVETDLGRDEFIKQAVGLIDDGYVKYFKLGEGGWSPSALISEQVGTGTGSPAVSCTFTKFPIVRGSIEIEAPTEGLTVIDDGEGGFTGDGSGIINYKTGVCSITFDSIIGGGHAINAEYRYRGGISQQKTEMIYDTTSATKYVSGYTKCIPLVPGTVMVSDELGQVEVDDGAGNIGTSGTVDYETGQIIGIVFTNDVPDKTPIIVNYKYYYPAKKPEKGLTDLESESDDHLYTFQKDLVPETDIVFYESVSPTSDPTTKKSIRITIELDTDEGNDDGAGDAPYYFEGGLFSENDVMLAYFTFPGKKKTSSDTISIELDLL